METHQKAGNHYEKSFKEDWDGSWCPGRSFGDLFPIAQSSGFPVMFGGSPSIPLDIPVMDIFDDKKTGSTRTLLLNINSPRSAQVIMLDVEPYTAVQSVTIAGKRLETIDSDRSLWSLTHYAPSAAGFDLTLELDPTQHINLQISDQTWELPPQFFDNMNFVIQSRPVDMMPMPNFDYGTVVVKTISLD